jgi:secondary thiamine-phosphate synthase enzyme
MRKVTVKTRSKRQIVDITEVIEAELRNAYAGRSGICHLSLLHTTAALTLADLDPGTDLDMLDAFEHMVPKLHYRHPHDPVHVPDHILSAVIGPTLSLLVQDGELVVGTWQRVVLIELDGGRSREIAMAVSAEV